MIMSIIRSSRNPRLPQLQPLSARYNLIKKITPKKKFTKKEGFLRRPPQWRRQGKERRSTLSTHAVHRW